MKNNISIIGMMGSGKTTIGAELQKVLSDYHYVDIDYLIEKSLQKRIAVIFLRFGEQYFRKLECDKIKSVLKNDNQIISLGGGAFESIENRKLLLKNSKVIYLKTSPICVFERIKKTTHRPLLKRDFSLDRIEEIMKKRAKNYEKAHITVDTSDKSPYNVVKEILEKIK